MYKPWECFKLIVRVHSIPSPTQMKSNTFALHIDDAVPFKLINKMNAYAINAYKANMFYNLKDLYWSCTLIKISNTYRNVLNYSDLKLENETNVTGGFCHLIEILK